MDTFLRISRSTVEKYIQCPRCCVLEKIHNIKPPSLPFTLNIAVDNLCKNEFDHYRNRQEPHPLCIENRINAVPFNHKDINIWRNNYKGLRYKSIDYNYDFGGAIDDVWLKDNGELIIVDVKSTAKNKFDWNDIYQKYDYPKSYKRQLEMYQWLFEKNGFKVAKEAYILYFNGKKNKNFFNKKLEFDFHLIKLNCSTKWVEKKIFETVDLLRSKTFPKSSKNCEYCNYLKKRWHLSQRI